MANQWETSQISNSRALNLLLVEDSSSDAYLIRRSLRKGDRDYQISWVDNGEKALKYLRQQPPYTEVVRPDLILLDLNLPGKDGREVLAEIKNAANLRDIPVAIVSTSSAPQDIRLSYSLYANCYIVKPVDIKDFQRVVETIEEFWFRTVALPSAHA